MRIRGNDDKIREAVIHTMQDVWPKVGRELMHELIDSMTTRVNYVLEVEGWHTRF